LKYVIKKLIVVLIFVTITNVIWSHPHIFIEQKIGIIFDKNGIEGFTLHWTFDEMFTSIISVDYDKNKNGVLEESEVKLVEKEAFSFVADYNYFFYATIAGESYQATEVKNFSAEFVNQKVVYSFFVPCPIIAKSDDSEIIIYTYDPSYYSAILFAEKEPTFLTNAAPFDIKCSIMEDTQKSLFYGIGHPWALVINFKKKPVSGIHPFITQKNIFAFFSGKF